MVQTLNKNEAPAYYYNEHILPVEYSFSEYTPANHWIAGSKIWLDILFVHPQHNETVTIRVAKSTLLLCQAKEVIEAIVHREIRQFLVQPQVKEYGLVQKTAQPIPAFC